MTDFHEAPNPEPEEEKSAGTDSTLVQLEEAQKKSEHYFDQLLRLQAEFSNYRQRMEKEKMDAVHIGKELMLDRLLTISDVMHQAWKYAEKATDVKSLQVGFKMVIDEFDRFLKSEGVEAISTQGQAFNPALHEAVEQLPTADAAAHDKIVEEVSRGYTLGGKMLRTAKVKVARALKNPTEKI